MINFPCCNDYTVYYLTLLTRRIVPFKSKKRNVCSNWRGFLIVDKWIPFFIMWGIPLFMMIRAYRKMDEKDRKSARKDFRSPGFIFTFGFLGLGLFIIQIGDILLIDIFKLIGIILLLVSAITMFFITWKEDSKIKSTIFLLLVITSIYFLY